MKRALTIIYNAPHHIRIHPTHTTRGVQEEFAVLYFLYFFAEPADRPKKLREVLFVLFLLKVENRKIFQAPLSP